MTKELPKSENFRMTLNGQPVFFVNKIELTTGDDECTKEKESEPWPTSFSLTATMECSSMSRIVHQLMGMYRVKRGSSRTSNQRKSCCRYYKARGNKERMKRKLTWKDVKEQYLIKKSLRKRWIVKK